MSEDIDESRICRLIQCCIFCEDLRGEAGVGRAKWINVACDHAWAVLISIASNELCASGFKLEEVIPPTGCDRRLKL